MKYTHTARYAIGSIALASSVFVALVALEGGSMRFATDRALAWSCALNASAVHNVSGTDVILSWEAADDVAYVSIDQFPGEQYGRNGSLHTTIHETTTFVARTHVDWTDEVMLCEVNVVVPNTSVDCDAVELSIDDTAFTWAGPPELTMYQATFCDGSASGVVENCGEECTTIDLEKRISEISATGGVCERIATQACPILPPEQPEPPTCPFSTSQDTAVVLFDGKKLVSNGTEDEAKTGPYILELAPGTYEVKSASWDGYVGRAAVTQPHEIWKMLLMNGGSPVLETSPTSDLEDMVLESLMVEELQPLEVATYTDSVLAMHAAYPDASDYNSVQPICAAFTSTLPEEMPACTLSASASLVDKGQNVTLSWTSEHAASASISTIGPVDLYGSTTVTIDGPVTYVGIFAADDGSEATCATSIAIRTPASSGGGSCLNCSSGDDDGGGDDASGNGGAAARTRTEQNPNVVLSSTVTRPGGHVTLQQVPYTGFAATPLMTVLFWLGILGFSAIVAYLLTAVRPTVHMRRVQREPIHHLADEMHSTMSQAAPVLVRAPSQPQSAAPRTDRAAEIEERAHQDNILLSPEATRMLVGATGDAKVTLENLFASARAQYPREDGWVLLSKERCEALLAADAMPDDTPTTPVIAANRMEAPRTEAPTVPTAASLEPQRDTRVVAAFVGYIAEGSQQKAFELLRTLNSKGIETSAFIARVVRELDEVYKHRLEGSRTPDQRMMQQTGAWSNDQLESVLGTLVECIDYSYTNARIGTKIALTKVFERLQHSAAA